MTLLVLLLFGWSPAAQADNAINIDHVESEEGQVSALVALDQLGSPADLETLSVTYAGEPISARAELIKDGDFERTTILVLDASQSMAGAPIEAAKEAAITFIDSAPADLQIGLVTFAGDVTKVAPTTNHELLRASIAEVKLSLGTRLYDAIKRGVGLAAKNEGVRSVLVLSDGIDKGSSATLPETLEAISADEVVVDVVSLDQEPEFQEILDEVATASGGNVIAAEPEALAEVFKGQADAINQAAIVKFSRPADAPGEGELRISVDSSGTEVSDTAFITIDGEPIAVPKSRIVPEPKTPPWVLWVGAGILALGLTGIVATAIVRAGPSALERQLAQYTAPGSAPATNQASASGQSVPNQILGTAKAAAERVVTGDFETRLALRLSGAGINWTAAEWMLLIAALALGGAFVGLVLRGVPLAIVCFLLGVLLPELYLRSKHSKRIASFNEQLPETLQLIAGGLSAGLSLPQSVDTVVREGVEPMAGEMRRALIEQRLGVDVPDALDGVAQRMGSKDFAWVVMALRIQREVGGNLSELLNTVAETIREREYLRRQVRVLSAEGRISAWILSLLPVVMFIYMVLVRPDFVRPLLTTPMGLFMLTLAGGLLAIGVLVLTRLVKVEV